jgi:hypothetical protein
MSRYLVQLRSGKDRETLHRMIDAAPYGTRVELKAERRSTDQNSKLWAMLSEVALQLPWHGVKLRPEDWKYIFLDALKREVRIVPNIDGTGFVNLGRSSSDLSRGEMADLITIIEMFGAQHGIVFADDQVAA